VDELLDGRDAVGVAEAIRDGDVSAVEVVDTALRRIEQRDPTVNAVVSVRAEEALKDAASAGDGPLAGVPFVVKDLGVDVAGLPTTNGSRLFADDVPDADSEIVARYRRAGLVIVAKTSSPELGRNASTEPVLFGPTRNPHDLSRSAGGSSGGTAAAVAAGMVPAGHGNDGGGSIRIPASACGLVGLKPTRARTPAHPHGSPFAYPLAVNHALTRSVRDSALLLDIAAGPLTGDPFVAPPPARPYSTEITVPPPTCRVALDLSRPDGAVVHPDCAEAARRAARLLESLGHAVVEARPPYPADELTEVLSTVMIVSLVADIDKRLAELDRDLRADDVEPFTRVLYDIGTQLHGAQVANALTTVDQVGRVMAPFYEAHDLLLLPTIAEPVPELGLLDTTDPDSMYRFAGNYSALTLCANVTGQPAISLPLATDADGLPVGVQLVAGFGREDLLLRVAAQIEEAQPWSIRPAWPAT
jgi:amidase